MRLTNKGMAFQSAAEVLFSSNYYDVDGDNVREKVYRQFMNAVRQFSIMQFLLRHGRVLQTLKNKFGCGRTGCPCFGAPGKFHGQFTMVDTCAPN